MLSPGGNFVELRFAVTLLKSIFRKTETRRQSHLVRMLMSLPGEAR